MLYSDFSLVVVCRLPIVVASLVAEGFPGGAVVKNPTANEGDAGDLVQSLGGKISWSKKWQPTPVFLPGKSHEQRGLVD